MTIQDTGVIASVSISVVSAGYIIYRDFLKGPKLHSSLDQITVLRLPDNQKSALITEMVLDDLLSDRPTPQAQAITVEHSNLVQVVSARNRDRLRLDLIEASRAKTINYNPSEAMVEKYFGDIRFSPMFFTPIIVFNSGSKFSHVSSLVLTVSLKADSAKKWAFSAFVEMDGAKLIPKGEKLSDAGRISGLFSGFVVGAGESINLNPLFTVRPEVEGRIISRESMKPGEYITQIFGYNTVGKRVFKTNSLNVLISKQIFLGSFNGAESSISPKSDQNIISSIE